MCACILGGVFVYVCVCRANFDDLRKKCTRSSTSRNFCIDSSAVFLRLLRDMFCLTRVLLGWPTVHHFEHNGFIKTGSRPAREEENDRTSASEWECNFITASSSLSSPSSSKASRHFRFCSGRVAFLWTVYVLLWSLPQTFFTMVTMYLSQTLMSLRTQTSSAITWRSTFDKKRSAKAFERFFADAILPPNFAFKLGIRLAVD